jgi:predicted transcriptional regulator
MTFAVPRDTAARLKEIAIVQNLSLERLLTLAVEEWLARQPNISGIEAAEPATCLDAPS